MSAEQVLSGTVQILRLPMVCQVTGLKRSMIYQLRSGAAISQTHQDRHPCGGLDRVRGAGVAGQTHRGQPQ